MHVDPATHAFGPVQPLPPHWPHLHATLAPTSWTPQVMHLLWWYGTISTSTGRLSSSAGCSHSSCCWCSCPDDRGSSQSTASTCRNSCSRGAAGWGGADTWGRTTKAATCSSTFQIKKVKNGVCNGLNVVWYTGCVYGLILVTEDVCCPCINVWAVVLSAEAEKGLTVWIGCIIDGLDGCRRLSKNRCPLLDLFLEILLVDRFICGLYQG